MDYKAVKKEGYAAIFKKEFSYLYNFFALREDSPAINKGMRIPENWPQTRIVKDSAPDIGAYESGSDNGALLQAPKEKNNSSRGFWKSLGF
jgi:hypothetical protein